MQQALELAYWVPLLPLIGFLVNGLGRNRISRPVAGLIGAGVIGAAFAISLWIFLEVRAGGSGEVRYFDFISAGNLVIPFSLSIDALTALFQLIITGVGFLIHVYSASYMKEETAPQFARYFSFLNLFVFSMLLLVMGGNLVILFIGWEGVGLCSYLLIGYWFSNPDYAKAANKAFIMNRIGDLAFLIALFWIIQKTGTVSYTELFTDASLTRLTGTDLTIITLLLFIGATGKSAQIPLYTWLPDAMAGPTPVSALIHAATMVTAGIYLIARCNLLYSMAPLTLDIITWTGLATALLAASIALRQHDIKKVLAYSTVSQLGFMFLALGCGAYAAAVFHVMTHAFFKALLFLGSGSVIHAMGGAQDIRQMGGLSRKLRITYFTFLIGCIAIAGIPPFSGFFSKDAILLSAYLKSPLLYGIALFAALLTAFYMFRLLFTTFSGTFRGTAEQEHHVHESPAAMTLPLIVLALLSVAGGWVGIPAVFASGADMLGQFLGQVKGLGVESGHHVSVTTEFALMGISTTLVLAMVAWAWLRYRRYRPENTNAFARVLENKWYIDEAYQAAIVRPLHRLGGLFRDLVENRVVDGLVNGVGRLVQYGGRQLRLLQSGQVGSYVLLMVLSMVAFFILQFFLRK
jgi:NADH-quinone oxidoreductase subunit L